MAKKSPAGEAGFLSFQRSVRSGLGSGFEAEAEVIAGAGWTSP